MFRFILNALARWSAMKTSLLSVFSIFMFLGNCLAQNLECNYNATACEAYANADAVFVGKVISIAPETIEIWQRDKDYDQRTVITIEKTFKGLKKKSLVLHQLGKDIAPKFILGLRYMFYANFDRVSRHWKVKPCGRTRMLKFGADDLRYGASLPASAGKTRISGEITRYESDAENPQGTSERLAGVKIKIVGDGKEYEAVTDAKGVYEISDVPPGKYRLEPSIPKGLRLMAVMHYGLFDRSKYLSLTIELKEGGCSGATVILTSGSR